MAGLKDVTLTFNVDTSAFRLALASAVKAHAELDRALTMAAYAAQDAALSVRLFFSAGQRRREEVIVLREGDHAWQVEQWRKWGLLDTQEQVLEAARGALGHGNDGSLALAFLRAGVAQ